MSYNLSGTSRGVENLGLVRLPFGGPNLLRLTTESPKDKWYTTEEWTLDNTSMLRF